MLACLDPLAEERELNDKRRAWSHYSPDLTPFYAVSINKRSSQRYDVVVLRTSDSAVHNTILPQILANDRIQIGKGIELFRGGTVVGDGQNLLPERGLNILVLRSGELVQQPRKGSARRLVTGNDYRRYLWETAWFVNQGYAVNGSSLRSMTSSSVIRSESLTSFAILALT